MQYHAHYDDNTYTKLGECPSREDILYRQSQIRQLGLTVIGEVWVDGYGYTPLWEGKELSVDDQNMLNIKACEPKKVESCVGYPMYHVSISNA